MRASVVAVPVVSLAVGLLIGFFLGPGNGDIVSAPGAEETDPHETAAPDREPVADPDVPSSESPAASAPEADGRIEGRVVTPTGAPVAGVVVTACRESPREMTYGIKMVSTAGPPDLDDELARTLAEYGAQSLYRKATRREAVSDDDGRFVISGLSDHYHWIHGFREGLAIDHPGDVHGAHPGETVKLVAERLVRLQVRVVGPDGAPPARAAVDVDDRESRTILWTPDRTSVEVVPGTVKLKAEAGGERLESEQVEIEVGDPPPDEPVVLRLSAVLTLEGSVSLPLGANRELLDIVVLQLSDGEEPPPERLLEEGMRESLSGRGTVARFRFRNMDPARYLVGVVRLSEAVLSSKLVTIRDGPAVAHFSVPDTGEESPHGTLVRVFAPDGSPEPFVHLNVGVRTPQSARNLGRVVRLSPGVFRILTPEVVPEGTCHIGVRSEEYGSRDVVFDPAAGGEVTIRLEEPASLKVVMADYVGSRYEGKARLCVAHPGKGHNPRSPSSSVPEPDGSQVFGKLPPGEWEITLWFGMGSLPLVSRPVTLAPGRREVVLDLPRLCLLEVVLDDGDDGKGFYLQRLDGPAGHGYPEVGTDGRIRIDGIVPGEYVLSRHRGPREHMPLTIAGDRTVRFRPIVLDALRIEIADAEGTLARSGLRHGDLVTAVDGTDITNEGQGLSLLKVGETAGKAVFTVVRDGRTLEVTVDLKGYRDPKRSGGEIRPWRR